LANLRWLILGVVGALCHIGIPVTTWSAEPAVHKDWPSVTGDATNQRYSPLNQINRENVDRLGGAWMSAIFPDGASSRATPAIHDGLMFLNAGQGVYALDATNGKIVWSWLADRRPAGADIADRVRAGIGTPNFQGVSTGDGRVYVGLMNGSVAALNEKTGAMLWTTNIGAVPPMRAQSVSDTPIYAKGMVIAGMGAGDNGLRGRIVALDARTGKILWTFFTVPAPGEFGHDTWPQDNETWTVGGGGVWQVGTVDEKLGMVYYVVGNTAPDWGGELRGGDNLFTSSVVALDLKTGRRKWHFQGIHHDIWDGDIATAPVLYDIKINGKMRKGIAAIRPDGYLFLLDRATGKPLVPVEERLVPQNPRSKSAQTQPFPVGGESMLPDCTFWKDKIPKGFVCDSVFFPPSFPPPSQDPPNVLAPVMLVRNTPMSYSPQTGFFYARGTAMVSQRRRAEDPLYFTAFVGFVPHVKSYGILAAFDARTSKIAWQQMMPPETLGSGGSMTTAGGLMFRLGGDGNFTAHDARTGNIVWRFQTGYRGGGGPPAAYEIDGAQYIAVSVGPVVWAFRLNGAVPPVATSAPSGGGGGGGGGFKDTDRIETTLVTRDMGMFPGERTFTDPYSFNPPRARVKAGTTVSFSNTGRQTYTVVAEDGSWTTGPIPVTEARTVHFDKPGIYTYAAKEFPWSYGQIMVTNDQVARNGAYITEQATRGRALYTLHCASCHLDSLQGSDKSTPLIGTTFADHWYDRTFGELYDKIRTTMPQMYPNSLTAEQYLDVMAYLLQSNDFPRGPAALIVDSQKLKTKLKDSREGPG
jgi:quinohemoprotein ethanol dehydrogenase